MCGISFEGIICTMYKSFFPFDRRDMGRWVEGTRVEVWQGVATNKSPLTGAPPLSSPVSLNCLFGYLTSTMVNL